MIPHVKQIGNLLLNSLYGDSFLIDILFRYFNFYILVDILLGLGMLHGCAGVYPRKDGVSRSSSI